MIITGDKASVDTVNAVGEEIDKDVLVSHAKRATAVNPSEEVK